METTIAYLLCAGRVIQDENTHKISAIDIFQIIRIPENLNQVLQYFTVLGKIVYVDAADTGAAEISIIDPDGKNLQTVTLSGSRRQGELNIIARFDSVVISKVGNHTLKLKLDGEELDGGGRFYFTVIK